MVKNLDKNTKIKITAIAIVVLLIASYVIYHLVLASKSEIETQIVIKETVYKTIDTQGFFIRDEDYVHNSYSGTPVSFVKNGERVAAGDTVSVVFGSEEDAASYLKINELEKDIAHYEELSGQANFQKVNIDSLNQKIDNELISFLESLEKRDYISAVSNSEMFRDSVTGKQIATGSDFDFTKEIDSLNSQLSQIKGSAYSAEPIFSHSAGYYINGADGYENTVSFDNIDNLTVSQIEDAIASKPASVAGDVVGRVSGSFYWYIACSVPTEKTVSLTLNDTVYVNVPYEGLEKVPVTLYKIGSREGDTTLLILQCDLMNEFLADLRIEDIEIVTEEYSGFKISNSAIRTVNGEKGVYIVRGKLVGFRKIHIVYTTDTYTIVDNPTGEDDYIKQYDNVVTKGVELYDNKLL